MHPQQTSGVIARVGVYCLTTDVDVGGSRWVSARVSRLDVDARLSPHILTSSQRAPATTIFGFSPTHTAIQRTSIGYDMHTLSKAWRFRSVA